jgi:hypothetical protein
MGLLDSYDPQGFAVRGGMLGRLLSLRPDLVPDEQGDERSAQDRTVRAQAPQPNDISISSPISSAIGNVLGDFYRQSILQPIKDIPGYVHDAVSDPAYFAHAIGPSLGGLGSIASELPAVIKGALRVAGLAGSTTQSVPPEAVGSATRDIRTTTGPNIAVANVNPAASSAGNAFGPAQGGLLPGLALAAALASRKSSELLGGLPQPIAPVFPEPPVPSVAPQAPWLPPPASPVAPQTPAMPPYAIPIAPQLGRIPPELTPAPASTPASLSDDWQQALGPEWQRLQSFINNTRDNGPAISEPESEAEKAERCRKQEEDAIKRCSELSLDDNRNLVGPRKNPWSMSKCIKGFLSPDCGGYDSRDPKYFFPPFSRRPIKRRYGL